MFNDVLLSFRRFCLQSKSLPPDLHIKLSDIIKNAGKSLVVVVLVNTAI